MPYNLTAIPRSDESTGSAVLPLARVKKTISADEEIGPVAAQSAFVITKATELFAQYLTEKSFSAGRAEARTTKKSLLYRDIASIVARTDNLEFLSDVVPQTTTWASHKEKKAREIAGVRKPGTLPVGQQTLDSTSPLARTDGEAATSEPWSPNGYPHSEMYPLEFHHYAPDDGPRSEPRAQDDVDIR